MTELVPPRVNRAEGERLDGLVLASMDIGRAHPAIWAGKLVPLAADGRGGLPGDTHRVATLCWSMTPLDQSTTAGAQQAELARRAVHVHERLRVDEWCIEQQLPHNRATGRSENVAAYGLQCAVLGALSTRPSAGEGGEGEREGGGVREGGERERERSDTTSSSPAPAPRRVYVRSPRHKFGVLGVDKRLLADKRRRKQLVVRVGRRLLEATGTARPGTRMGEVLAQAGSKQDDLFDAMLMGMCGLLERDAKARRPRCANLLAFLRREAQASATAAQSIVKK